MSSKARTPSDAPDAQKLWRAKVSEAKGYRDEEQILLADARDRTRRAMLLAFKIGRIVHELPRSYGSNAVARFAKECGFSVGAARDYHYLYRGAASEGMLTGVAADRKFFQAVGHYIDGVHSDAPRTDPFRTHAHLMALNAHARRSADEDGDADGDIARVRQVSTYLKGNRERIRRIPLLELAYRNAYFARSDKGMATVALAEPPEGDSRAAAACAAFSPVEFRFHHHVWQLLGFGVDVQGDGAADLTALMKGVNTPKGHAQVMAAAVNAVEDLHMRVDEGHRLPPVATEDKLILGDCLKALKDGRLFPRHSVSAVVTDPPFGGDYEGSSGYRPARRVHFRNPPTSLDAARLVGKVARLLRDREIVRDSHVWLVFWPIDRVHLLVPELLGAFDGQDLACQVLVWDKLDGGMKLAGRRWFRRDAEAIVYLNVNGKPLSPEIDGKRETLHSSVFKYRARSEEKATFQYWKPPELLRHLIQLAAFGEDQLVLDPFAGRGSTGVAAIALGKDFRLIECDAGQHRIVTAAIRTASRDASRVPA
jgi:predicted RNA methylase